MNEKIVKGHPLAIKVYKEYHSAIGHAKQIVKKGIIFDITPLIRCIENFMAYRSMFPTIFIFHFNQEPEPYF